MSTTRYQRVRTLAAQLDVVKAENEKWRATAANQYSVIRMQALILSDAGDIFDQVNLGHVWQRVIDNHLGQPTRTIHGVGVYEDGTPQAVAHQREAHDTLTAH